MSDLTFNSVEEQAEAISSFNEETGTIEELQNIQNAEIVEKDPEAVSETPEETPAKEPEKESEPELTPEPQAEPVEKEPAPQPEDGKIWTLKPEDLPENYDTPGKAFKTLKHQAEYIKKQDEQMEALRQKLETQPAPPAQPPEQPVPPASNDYDTQIKDIEEKILRQYDEDPLSPDIYKMQRQVISLERDRLRDEIKASKEETVKLATGQFEEYRQSKENERIQKLNTEALENDYQEFDSLGKEKEYKEYAMTKPAKEVEKDFLALRDAVVTAYYNRPAQNWQELNNALYQYNIKAPALMTKLQAMEIPTEYPQDVATFLELSKMLNDRDGVRYNENGQQVPFRKRWDPVKGEEVPDRFPDLKATIEHQRVTSGHYKKQALSAYDKGSKDSLAAQRKRDHGELSSNDGNLGESVATLQQLIAERDKIPEGGPNANENLKKLMEYNKKIEEMAKQPTG